MKHTGLQTISFSSLQEPEDQDIKMDSQVIWFIATHLSTPNSPRSQK